MSDLFPEPRIPRRWVRLVPLAIFALVAAVFLIRLETGGNREAIPSALVGRPAPAFNLPPLDGVPLPGLATSDLAGKPTVVNVFASWCGPCRMEHPQITELARDRRIQVVGLNYKDRPGDARRFLAELGNPYGAIGVDERGRTAIDWGVYGVPETFIVGADGTILYKFVGPISPAALEEVIRPEIEKALASAG